MEKKFTLRGARGTKSRKPDVSGQVDLHEIIRGAQHPGQIHQVPGRAALNKVRASPMKELYLSGSSISDAQGRVSTTGEIRLAAKSVQESMVDILVKTKSTPVTSCKMVGSRARARRYMLQSTWPWGTSGQRENE